MNEHIKTLQANGGKGYLSRAIATELAGQGLVQMHESAVDSNGNPAVRLTDKGMNMTEPTNTASAATTDKPKLVFDTGIAKPAKAARNERKSGLYDDMPVSASVHFANGDYKKLSALPGQLQRRYSEPMVDGEGKPVMTTTKKGKSVQKRTTVRKFSVARVDATDPKGAGVRLFRDA